MAELLRTQWELGPMRQTVDQLRREMPRVPGAAIEAHTNMAKAYQRRLQAALREQIEAHGRQQRGSQRLMHYLGSKRAREADEGGWSVGLTGAPGLVRAYGGYLETGTERFIGRYMRGYFNGEPPSSSGSRHDLFQYVSGRNSTRGGERGGPGSSRFRPRQGVPVFRIRRPIPAYRYFETASQKWISGGKLLDAGFYGRAFRKHGLPLTAGWIKEGGIGASDVTFVGAEFSE